MDSISNTSEWTLICTLDSRTILGALNGCLYTGDQDRPKREVDLDDPVGLLPLLEQPLASFFAGLASRELELGLKPGALRRLVPWRTIPMVASRSHSPYWSELAIRWLADMAADDRDTIALHHLSGDHWVPQGVRHKAARMLRGPRSAVEE